MRTITGAVCAGAAAALMLLLSAPAVRAQARAVAARITAQVDDTRTVQLTGNVHPLARPEFDRGAVADSQPMTRMLLLLQRSPEQEAALQQMIDAQQTKGSGSYRAWLTPAQFGKQFGPADADVQTISDWLTGKGFQVANVAAGRNVIEFSGTAGQVRTAFHTEIHNFEVNGGKYFANVSEPAIPEALAPVVKGVVALHNFPKTSHRQLKGEYQRDKATGTLRPLFTYGNPANFAIGPADLAKLYNIPSTATGAGQSIAVIGQSNINPQDVTSFRHMFGIDATFPANNVTVIVNGPDPGIVGPNGINCSDTSSDDEGESDVDVEWAGAIAPAATIYLVTSETTCTNPTQVTAGIDLSAVYAVDNNVAPIISESYGGCEGFNGAAGNQFYYSLWEQAAAEGITVVVSTGDSGSAECDSSGAGENAASFGVAVSGLSSTPFNVAAGGTDFEPSTVPASGTSSNQYWAGPNGNLAGSQSVLQYIPETPWNGSACATNFPTLCNSVNQNGDDLSAGGGGPSNCVVATVNSSGTGFSCSTSSTSTTTAGGWIMPSWQMSVVPGAGTTYTTRTQPDVSLFSSNGSNLVSLVVCQSDALTSGATSCDLNSPYTNFLLAGGTSFAAPSFAGIMALVNQSQATTQNPTPRQGNANFVLYGLAATDTNYTGAKCNSATPPISACTFNDVVQASNTNGVEWNNSVACVSGSTNCSQGSNSSVPYGILVLNSNPAFVAGQGYNLATGIGSVNVTNLLANWGSVSRATTTTTLTNASTTMPVSGGPFQVTVTVTGGTTTPVGDVSLTALDGSGNVLCQDVNVTANVCSFGPFTLGSGGSPAGSVVASTTLIPPGAASVTATYGGDATHALSTGSLPFTSPSTGAGQSSQTTLGWSSLGSNGAWSTPTNGSQNFTYGVPLGYILSIVVTGGSGNNCGFNYPSTTPSTAIPCPTGTIKLYNGNVNTPQNDFPNGTQNFATNVAKLNNQGMVEDQPINLKVGSYSLFAVYSGDGNYSSSTSNTLSVTLKQASTQTIVASSLGTVSAGSPVVLTATVGTNSNGDAPCGTSDGGTVAFTAGGSAISGTVTYTAIPPSSTAGASCTASISTTLTAMLPPTALNRRPTLPLWPMLFAALSLVLFALGWRWIPQNRRRAYAYAGMLAFALLAAGVAGCGGGGSSAPAGTTSVTINANYSGNVNYTSSSGSTTVFVQ